MSKWISNFQWFVNAHTYPVCGFFFDLLRWPAVRFPPKAHPGNQTSQLSRFIPVSRTLHGASVTTPYFIRSNMATWDKYSWKQTVAHIINTAKYWRFLAGFRRSTLNQPCNLIWGSCQESQGLCLETNWVYITKQGFFQSGKNWKFLFGCQ